MRAGELATAVELRPVREQIDQVASGLDLLGNVIGSLKIDDTTQRTTILENITDAFGRVNRTRATIEGRYRDLAAKEGRSELAAQIRLITQTVASALAQCDTPERCDQELTRLLVQLEELEGRFADVDELTAEIVVKREEIVDAVGARKQLLATERQRRAANLHKAAVRILDGVPRRAATLTTSDEVNAYFASDAMIAKLRDLIAELQSLGDSVRADEIDAKLKTARQDALRGQRDRADLFEGGGSEVIKLGAHRFAVNSQPLEAMIVPHPDDSIGGLALHLSGTDFYEPLTDPELLAARHLWAQDLPSESPDVYRGEYLAASVLAEADAGTGQLTTAMLVEASRAGTLEASLRQIAQERYDEGYERGVHDHDAAAILSRLLAMRETAGLLAYSTSARALARVFWGTPHDAQARWHRAAQSHARLVEVLGDRGGRAALAREIAVEMRALLVRDPSLAAAGLDAGDADLAAAYLVRELSAASPELVASGQAIAIVEALDAELAARNARTAFDEDLRTLAAAPGAALSLARAWVDGVIGKKPELATAALEAATLLAIKAPYRASSANIEETVTGLLGRHPRIKDGALRVRLDELVARLERFRTEVVPAFRAYRALRASIVERERSRLRLGELVPRVMSSFVRNQLIDQVYLPLCGANLAKQLGATGNAKRTDQMGMLLLVSPPGYGKTTLMEYIAARLGLAFVKVNGPALGHEVTSLDPVEAPNATARQEIEKVSFALEMGTNVMLYLDDIQHTSPELLQKFISLCDAQRKIEGVWRGRTRTYDLRGKKFCVVMAGNPYTESGEQFRIPDMLANRADVYNLGEVLAGKGDAFALSFLENALTSTPALAPLATRPLDDVYKLIRMAQGEPIPTTELSHGYSSVELEEILTVMRHLFAARKTLLAVNAEYIRSAAQADAFRTEPPFKLQGSYRNMNKIAEKIVSALTPAELERLVEDHYQSESQTLTTAAEQNLLKLAELRGTLAGDRAKRWGDIKAEFVRQRRMGGSDADPVTKLAGTMTGLATELGERLGAIHASLGNAQLAVELRALRDALQAVVERPASPPVVIERPVEANGSADNWDAAAVAAQIRRIESSLVPVVSAAVDQRAGDTLLANKMVQIIELLEQLDARLAR